MSSIETSFNNLLVVGSMAFDAIETPFGKTDKIIGGAASYIAISAALYNVAVKIVSVIGNDFDENFLAELTGRNIDLAGVEKKLDQKSFFWSGKYHNDMNSRDTLITELNVLADFNPILPTPYTDVDYLLLGNLSPSVQSSVIKQMTIRPKLIAMDTMNFWMEIALDDLKHTLSLVDILIVNDEEARQLSGTYSLMKASKIIREMGPKYLIIKKGEHGALLFYDDKVFSAPGLPLEEVFDPTGAGDSFAGGFMGYIASKDNIDFETMKQAVIAGSVTASYCVEKFGTERLLQLSPENIAIRREEFKALGSF
ncbi:MAG: PfkB family carbohydrate kinase [Bacteroidota bacterium]|nr:PfkB family carbohydrate kinase [Bacteroidota bacterium]